MAGVAAYDDPVYREAVIDLLGVLAYGELTAFERLADDATLAPTLEDKAALAARSRADSAGSDRTNPSDEEDAGARGGKDKEKEDSSAAYNPKKSFFDSLSSPPPFAPKGQQQGAARGGGGGRFILLDDTEAGGRV